MSKLKLKSRMKNLIMFLPNMIVLCARLMMDSRVPRTERALLAAAVIYALIPFDFLPDMIPFLGQIDDIFLIALTLLRLIEHTDDRVVREHWRGGGDVTKLTESVVMVAPMLMPRRISRVLLSKVKPTAEGTGLLVNASKFEPLLVEVPNQGGTGVTPVNHGQDTRATNPNHERRQAESFQKKDRKSKSA